MSRFPVRSILAVLVLSLAAREGFAQCTQRSDLRQRYAAAPSPALGNSVAYTNQDRLTVQTDFRASGYACRGLFDTPWVNFSEATNLNVFGSHFSYTYMSYAKASGVSYVWLYLRTPSTSTTLAISYGIQSIAATMPPVSPRNESVDVGTLYVGSARFSIRPTLTFTVDPGTSYRATVDSRSASIDIDTGIATTMNYDQTLWVWGIRYRTTLSGTIQDVGVSGFANASASSMAASVRGDISFRDRGSQMSLSSDMFGIPVYRVSWSKQPVSLGGIFW